jgi:hypothetical protein
MSEQGTPPTTETGEVELGPDGTPVDINRAMTLIKVQREEVKQWKYEANRYRTAAQSLLAGREVDGETAAELTPPPDTNATTYEQTFRDIGTTLGLSDDEIAASTGPDALRAAARQARLAGPLAQATASAGVDHDLATALLTQSGALAKVDLSGDVAAQLSEAVGLVKIDHPQLVKQTPVPVSGVPFGRGSSQAAVVTQDALAYMDPETISALRAQGALSHLGVPGDKR